MKLTSLVHLYLTILIFQIYTGVGKVATQKKTSKLHMIEADLVHFSRKN